MTTEADSQSPWWAVTKQNNQGWTGPALRAHWFGPTNLDPVYFFFPLFLYKGKSGLLTHLGAIY